MVCEETLGTEQSERTAFQRFLDDNFPAGAICAVFLEEGRAGESPDPLITGRLLCSAVTQRAPGLWWHEILIDPRRTPEDDTAAMKLWVGTLRQHETSAHLWEGEVRTVAGERRILRLNASPPPRWRPTPGMRRAVTEAHPEL